MPQRRRRKRHGACIAAHAPTADAANKVWALGELSYEQSGRIILCRSPDWI